MNTTINLVDHLLVKGRALHKLGIAPRALHLLQRLSSFRDLPKAVAHESRLRLAQLHASQKKFRRARRLLATLAADDPQRSRVHYLLARLAAADVRCDPRCASRHFRQALTLDPMNARYLSALGTFGLKNGKEALALRSLRRAFQLAPTDRVVVQRYIKALQKMHRLGEAQRIIAECRFALGRQRWFQDLSSSFRFLKIQLRQRQQRRQQNRIGNQPLRLLPFRTAQVTEPRGDVERLRCDGPAVLPAAHLPLPLRRPDQRHAQ